MAKKITKEDVEEEMAQMRELKAAFHASRSPEDGVAYRDQAKKADDLRTRWRVQETEAGNRTGLVITSNGEG